MFGPLTLSRVSAQRRGAARDDRFAGVAAGPAEQDSTRTTSSGYLGEVGEPFEIVVRVAGTTPRHAQDGPDVVRHCFRTVDSGLALCCPLPNTQHLRLGSVVRVRGSVTGQRTQGINDVTEISAESIERMG